MTRWLTSVGVLAGLLLPAAASAQYYPQQQQVVYVLPTHTHDGFMLRLAIGAAFVYAPIRAGGGGADIAIGGGGLIWDIAAGFHVRPGLALNADFYGVGVVAPNIFRDGGVSTTGNDVTFYAGALGFGITNWIEPMNIYIAPSIGFAVAGIETDFGGSGAETEIGLGVNLMVGKEWWIGPHLGIGVAGQVFFMTLPDNGDRVDVFAIGVLFSATID